MCVVPESTCVFVERIAPNAAMLHPHPQESAAAVAQVLVDKGWAASVVGPEKPVRGGVLFFDGSEFDDAVLGEIASALNASGVGSFAYELVDSVDFAGEPTLVFHRSGSFPSSANRVILTHTYLFDDMATTWLFGAPEDLDRAALLLSAECDSVKVMPVYSFSTVSVPDGSGGVRPAPESVEIRHLLPTLDGDAATDVAAGLVDVLTLAGFSGPIIVTDHREGPDGEGSRLEASY